MINSVKIMNPKALTNIFGILPDFIGSELMAIRIKSFRRTMFIQLMTTQPVQAKPKRWDKWDVIYVEISLGDIRDLVISGDVRSNSIIQFDLEKVGEEGLLRIKCNNEMYIRCTFDWARIEQITPGLIGSL